jgi:hypothetical protein
MLNKRTDMLEEILEIGRSPTDKTVLGFNNYKSTTLPKNIIRNLNPIDSPKEEISGPCVQPDVPTYCSEQTSKIR